MDKDEQIQGLLSRIAALEQLVQEQSQLIQERTQLIELQAQKILALEKQLKKNSNNSSKPPSSDGLSKPMRTKSLRAKGKHKSGGQPGHRGHTLKQVSEANETKRYELLSCPCCCVDLSRSEVLSTIKRQVFDIRKPSVYVTEHQVEVKWCSCCSKRVQSWFPAGVNAPAQYGNRIKAWAVYFQQVQLIPEDRLQSIFEELWGISITTSTLNRFSQCAYDGLLDFENQVLSQVKSCAVKHLDETGFRVGGKTQWLHVASTQEATYYHISPKRKSLLEELVGIVVHDHWKPYYQLNNVLHALCNAHHLRELNALVEHEKESWARNMKRCLLLGLHYRHKHADSAIPENTLIRLKELYERIVKVGLDYHESLTPLKKQGKRGRTKRRTGHNLLLRLQTYQADVLRFLYNSEVPFTNNDAERDLRMMKCKQKISGSFRTELGAKVFARIRGFISTARKQRWNLFDSLEKVVSGQVVSIV